jgi:hypothetical protein
MPEFLSLRHAARVLTGAPAFSALAVTILAIGIGATTLMFTLVQAVLLRDLPFTIPAGWSGCTTSARNAIERRYRFRMSKTTAANRHRSPAWRSSPTLPGPPR